MKKKKNLLYHIVNILAIGLVVECFLCAILLVQKHAQKTCMERIQETTAQVSTMFSHSMEERLDKLTVFADILAANSENPAELLHSYMDSFCRTQYFTSVCIHRHDGYEVAYGNHPHNQGSVSSFQDEVDKLPYTSKIFSYGDTPAENFVFQAVPIVRDGQTIAVLYGYTSLELFPDLIASSAYGGACRFHIVDGDTGNLLMDPANNHLRNLFDGSMDDRQVKSGYSLEQMHRDVAVGASGFFVSRLSRSSPWYYTCYMPIGINNWSMQLTIDEPTAFASYKTIHGTMLVLMAIVVVLIIVLILSLMFHNAQVSRLDKQRLHVSSFIGSVQRSLLNAHENPDFVAQALKTVAQELQAETVLLLSFTDKQISSAQYWPSKDKAAALDLVGRNIRDEFPVIFDQLSTGQSVYYDHQNDTLGISESAAQLFRNVDAARMILVPITDTAGGLKGVLAAVNAPIGTSAHLMESVTYDFYMAITNLEHHALIQHMGSTDYLTRTKNRNSYETELGSLAVLECASMWCMYVDVNDLREVNNQLGHKAGDIMLCAVADAIKRVLGSKYTYRLGGDEFLAFAPDATDEALAKHKKAILTELAAKGYTASIGFAGSLRGVDGTFDMEQIIAQAEEVMYQEKRDFHHSQAFSGEQCSFLSE